MNGETKPSGSNNLLIKLKMTRFVMSRFSGMWIPSKEKQSSFANHFMPKTRMTSSSTYLSWNSWCNSSATTSLLEPHFTNGKLAWFMTADASWMNEQASSCESEPESKSSTYKFSFNSCVTWDWGTVDKWYLTVAFNRKGLLQLPNGTLQKRITLCSPWKFQRNLWTSRSWILTPIWRKAFSMSAVIANFHLRKRINISVSLVNKLGPMFMQLLRDMPLYPLQDASNTGRTFVVSLFSLTTGLWGR